MNWATLRDKHLVGFVLVVMLAFSIFLFFVEMGDRDRLFRIAMAQQAEIQTRTEQVTELTGMVHELLQKTYEPAAPAPSVPEAEAPLY